MLLSNQLDAVERAATEVEDDVGTWSFPGSGRVSPGMEALDTVADKAPGSTLEPVTTRPPQRRRT